MEQHLTEAQGYFIRMYPKTGFRMGLLVSEFLVKVTEPIPELVVDCRIGRDMATLLSEIIPDPISALRLTVGDALFFPRSTNQISDNVIPGNLRRPAALVLFWFIFVGSFGWLNFQ